MVVTAAGEIFTFGWNVFNMCIEVNTTGSPASEQGRLESDADRRSSSDGAGVTELSPERVWLPRRVPLEWGLPQDSFVASIDGEGDCTEQDGSHKRRRLLSAPKSMSVALGNTLSCGGWHAAVACRIETE